MGARAQPADFGGEAAMDFIERWFGVSPDGGDGSLEVLYVLAGVVVIVAIVFRARIRSAIQRKSSTGARKTPE
jgi:hypothetical protein